MRILIIDDHQLVRDIMTYSMEKSLGIETMCAETVKEALSLIEKHGPFSCVLADLRMPDVRTAFDLQCIVEANEPNPVALFSGTATQADLFTAKSVGMVAYIRKTMAIDEVYQIIRALIQDPDTIPQSAGFDFGQWNADTLPDALSEEDCAILEMVATGARNSEIANALRVNRTRIENRLRKIYPRIGVKNRLEAANYVTSRSNGMA